MVWIECGQESFVLKNGMTGYFREMIYSYIMSN